MTILITSTAFAANAFIPRPYTGEGDNISPPLAWNGVPAGAQELALICEDPDAPTPQPWTHWVVYKLSPILLGLAESAQGDFLQGRNDFGEIGYGGPLPPRGHGLHHYHFRLYALDEPLQARPELTKAQLLSAIEGHILGQGELIGVYERT